MFNSRLLQPIGEKLSFSYNIYIYIHQCARMGPERWRRLGGAWAGQQTRACSGAGHRDQTPCMCPSHTAPWAPHHSTSNSCCSDDNNHHRHYQKSLRPRRKLWMEIVLDAWIGLLRGDRSGRAELVWIELELSPFFGMREWISVLLGIWSNTWKALREISVFANIPLIFTPITTKSQFWKFACKPMPFKMLW